ncbi:MAG: hypothetical protein NZV14_12930 [Bryobacteraceae bacterium]|nr:hypothetical protein [Bryobacteraceae bacterium]MDW8379060.1 hypothetical protein [Bryobacterales bacterium]
MARALRPISWVVFTGLLLSAADKKPISARASNPDLKVECIAHLDKEAVKQLLGTDLGGNIVVLELTVTPRPGKPIKIFGDDFTLHSYKDGQKSQPFHPSQLAGGGALQLSERHGGGVFTGNPNGPIWGGLGGGRPRRLNGDGGQIGNANTQGSAEVTAQAEKSSENPLLEFLKKNSLPEGEIEQPVKGYLYFPLEGKHKAKDLALIYRGQAGKLTLEFQQ